MNIYNKLKASIYKEENFPKKLNIFPPKLRVLKTFVRINVIGIYFPKKRKKLHKHFS